MQIYNISASKLLLIWTWYRNPKCITNRSLSNTCMTVGVFLQMKNLSVGDTHRVSYSLIYIYLHSIICIFFSCSCSVVSIPLARDYIGFLRLSCGEKGRRIHTVINHAWFVSSRTRRERACFEL